MAKSISFKIKGRNYTEDQVKHICKYNEFDLYGIVDDGYDKKYTTALENNGFAGSAKGSNGVKIIKNSVIELKRAKDNERLYSSELHKNPYGDMLVIFDKDGNHNKMDRIIKQKKEIKITKCDFADPKAEAELATDTTHPSDDDDTPSLGEMSDDDFEDFM